jgi:hypothetical protein
MRRMKLKILQLFTFIPNNVFSSTFYYQRLHFRASTAPSMREIFRLKIYTSETENIILIPPSRHAAPTSTTMFRKLGNLCNQTFVMFISLYSPLVHIWLRPPFFVPKMDNTYARYIGEGIEERESEMENAKARARVELKNR